MPSFGSIIERNALLFPDRPAIKLAERTWTHRQFAQRTRKLASALYARGLHKQDRFSVLAMNGSEFLECYAAAQWSGLVIHTLNFRLAANEMDWIIKDAEPRLLIFESQFSVLIDSVRAQWENVEHYLCIGKPDDIPDWAESYESALEAGDERGPPIRGGADDAACLMYTSGTTGKAKGVVHSNRSIARVAEVLSSELKLDGETRLLAIAPLFHMGAAALSWGALYRGGCAVIHRGFDAGAVIRTIESERIDAIHLVPTMVQSLLDAPEFGQHDFSSLRMLMYAAAPMPLPLLRRAVAAFGPITYNGYGQTEINLITLLRPHQHVLDGDPANVARLASVGQSHWQSELRIIDDEGGVCAPGDVGEVCARSETAMTGYWKNSAATEATVKDGWVHTGDVGYMDSQGFLFLVDRKHDVIISGGENVYSREVEDALLLHPAVADAAVIGVHDPRWGEAVKAIVVVREGHTLSADALIDFCKSQIASYKAPKTVELVDVLPRLNTGKTNKVELRQRFAPSH